MLRTDYAIHDASYVRKRKNPAFAGWNDVEGTQDNLIQLANWVADRPTGRILELGCGAGDQALWFAGRGYEAVGVDISAEAIDWAREKATKRGLNATFTTGSVLDLPFEDASFDYILDGYCWHCIIGDDRTKFLAEAARVLRPGGIFTSITMVNDSRYPGGDMEYDRERHVQFMNGIAVRYWTRTSEALEDLRVAGLDAVRYEERAADDVERKEDLLFVDARRRE